MPDPLETGRDELAAPGASVEKRGLMRARRALLLPLLVGASLTVIEGVASAQTQEFSVQRFEPAPGADNFLGVETLRMDGQWHWSVGLFFNYSLDPFVVQSCTSTTTCSSATASPLTETHVVRDMYTWDLLASLSPRPWLQLGLRLPVSYVQGDGLDLSNGNKLTPALSAASTGDPDLEGKVRLFGTPGSKLLLGLGGDISFPAHSLSATNFIGDSSPLSGGLRGILDGRMGAFSYGANLRALFRKDVAVNLVGDGAAVSSAPVTTVGSEFRYGAAAGYRVSPIFEVLAEGFGGTGFRSEPGTNSLEIDAAARIRPLGTNFAITLGGGAGLLRGVGVPAARAFAGILYAPATGDKDGDGIPDDVDKCPTIPEDFDGFEDHDGCPEPDNDGDKIPDELDKCPNEPETINGFQDADGCPDETPDHDHDGIPDNVDKCPDAGGPDIIRNPKSPYYGCPDRDHDGIPDYLDKCPDVPEPTDDLFDGSGCPHIRDTDGDGIPDDVDKCPNEPETYNGFEDADGCPDKGPTAVEITDTVINIHDRVEFASNKDKIQGAKSFQVLDAVAGIMNGRKTILLVEIQGHTDGAGLADANRKLSQKRAEAVVKYLVSKGVDKSRLTAKGYGPDVPVADNKTAKGRQLNRRVEFHILDGGKKGAPPPGPGVPVPVPAVAPPAPAGKGPAAPAGKTLAAPAPATPPAPAGKGPVGKAPAAPGPAVAPKP